MQQPPIPPHAPASPPLPGSIGAPARVDLTQYDQTWFDPGRPKWFIVLWWLVQGVVFPLTLHAHHAPRRWLLRRFGARVGPGVVIRPSVRVTYPWKVAIGGHSWLGDGVTLYSLERIAIGCHCVISQNSYLCTGSHDPGDPAFGLQVAPVVVENGAWVATDCFVGPGVTIGANAVIGTRSGVFRSQPGGYVCWGTPCQPQRLREL